MRLRKLSLALAGAALLAVTAPASESCPGEIFRSVARFRGTIRSVKTLSESATDVNLIDTDPLFVVTIDIEGGAEEKFAIHSPSRTFGSGKLVGRTFDLGEIGGQARLARPFITS